jgi:hypothetical protein
MFNGVETTTNKYRYIFWIQNKRTILVKNTGREADFGHQVIEGQNLSDSACFEKVQSMQFTKSQPHLCLAEKKVMSTSPLRASPLGYDYFF